MTPKEWAAAWRHPLIRARRTIPRLPPAASEFLVTVGLPRVMIFEWRNSFEIRFSELGKKLAPYNTLFKWGDFYNEALDREWSHHLAIGEQEFCNGHASFCIHEQEGYVSRLDCELPKDRAQQLVNSNVELWGASLLVAQQWSDEVHADGAFPQASDFKRLAKVLKQTDPKAFKQKKSFWPELIEEVLENPDDDPLELLITSDPACSKPRF